MKYEFLSMDTIKQIEMDTIVRPRLNDYHGILLLQDKVDYV